VFITTKHFALGFERDSRSAEDHRRNISDWNDWKITEIRVRPDVAKY
jgi:hypothetical protein